MKKPSRTPWPVLVLVLGTLASLAAASTPPAPGPSEPGAAGDGRVIVLGFDGADARTVRELSEAHPEDYPNFRRLAAEGTVEPLEGVAPPESPVSWAAINTGQNPAKTGVPGFVKRELSSGRPLPNLGHVGNEDKPLEELSNTPLPVWSRAVFGAVGGALGLVIGFLLVYLVARRAWVALVAGLLLGGAGGWGGVRLRGYLPDTLPRTTNKNQARNFWDFAGDAGVPCIVIDPAQAFDMPAPPSVDVLAGFGVPDARGGLGDWFLYTTDPEEFSRPPKGRTEGLTAGTVFAVDEYDGVIQTKLYGPKNFWLEEKLKAELKEVDEELARPELALETSMKLSRRKGEISDRYQKARSERTSVDMTIRREGETAHVTIAGQEQVLHEGEWSDFYELEFELNPFLSAHALTRVRIIHLDQPFFHMFVNVFDIDPRSPPFWQAISSPFGFSKELADQCGLFETYGWPTATMPFKDGLIPPELLLEDVEFTLGWRERLVTAELARDDWKVFMGVFSTTDRIQHMLYRYYDAGHPLHDAEESARPVRFFGETIPLSQAIPAIYKQMDRLIGRVLDEFLKPGDTLLVCADHGFQSFRRQVHVNNILAQLGYLKRKPLTGKRDAEMLGFVDWDNTQAYSLGMGFVYLNLQGREPHGIVKPSEADELLHRIRADFLKVRDPESGDKVCNDAYITKEIHDGPYLDLEADLLLGFAPTYRVSWASTFGGLAVQEDELGGYEPAPICSDNDSLWSGGHVSVALPDVAGVFMSNRKLAADTGSVKSLAIAPTALDLAGVPVPAEMDEEPLVFAE